MPEDYFIMGQPSQFCSIPFSLPINIMVPILKLPEFEVFNYMFAFLNDPFCFSIFSLSCEVFIEQGNNKHSRAKA
jgi:hypothetical protein